MPWIEGPTLSEWVEANLRHAERLAAMQRSISDIAAGLESDGVAHGDLQHGNVIIAAGDQPRLIDYDGMFVPALAGSDSSEAGHANYQHPERGQLDFGPHIDRFSAITIWTALEAVRQSPALWGRYDNGENMLFVARDFAEPGQSQLMLTLRGSPATRDIADRFERVVAMPVNLLPTLAEYIDGRLPAFEPRVAAPTFIAPYPVLDLRLHNALASHADRVTAVGEIIRSHQGTTRRGDPYLFIDIGAGGTRRIRIVVWSEVLSRLSLSQRNAIKRSRVVAITGVVTVWEGTTQIVLERAALLEPLTSRRIAELIGGRWNDAPALRPTAHLRVGDVVEHSRFGQGVVLRIERDNAEIRFGLGVKLIKFTVFPMRVIRSAAIRDETKVAAPATKRQPSSSASSLAGQSGKGTQFEADLADWMAMAGGQANQVTGGPRRAPATPPRGAPQKLSPSSPTPRPPTTPPSASGAIPPSAWIAGLAVVLAILVLVAVNVVR
jgi:hypothetical protein